MKKHSRLIAALDKADSDNNWDSDNQVEFVSDLGLKKRRSETPQKLLRGNATGLLLTNAVHLTAAVSPEIGSSRSVATAINRTPSFPKRRLSLPKKRITLSSETRNDTESVSVSSISKWSFSTGSAANKLSSKHSSTVNQNDVFTQGDTLGIKPLAVCANCGITSKDYETCESCKCRLPKNPKLYNPDKQQVNTSLPVQKRATSSASASSSRVSKQQSFYRNHLVASSYSYNCPIRRQKVPLKLQRLNGKHMKNNASDEPPVLTLSSDEELPEVEAANESRGNCSNIENKDSNNASDDISTNSLSESEGLPVTPTENRFETRGDSVSTVGEYLRTSPTMREGGIALQCRSIRFGSYKVLPTSPVGFTYSHISMKIPPVDEDDKLMTILIQTRDVVEVVSFLGHPVPVLFFQLSSSSASMIRSRLNMFKHEGPRYDSLSDDDTIKWVVLLPEKLQGNQRSFLKMVFADIVLPNSSRACVHHEVDYKTSNELLVRSAPSRAIDQLNILMGNKPGKLSLIARSPVIRQSLRLKRECKKLATYPPPPQVGGITVTSEDMKCLVPGEFLNDVIIDFYLKYLFCEKLSQEDRDRTHIFSSFFYKRLTNSDMASEESGPVNGKDTSRAASAQKRHSRVKTWTRHVDILNKDFIIVPINENAHWFLAVICFAYLVGVVGDEESCPPPSADHDYETDTLSETTSCEALSSQDDSGEKNGAKSEDIFSDLLSAPLPQETTDMPRRPCILIFDSLSSRNSWNHIIVQLREYLSIEFQQKRGFKREFTRETIRGSYPKAPQQTNSYDCGLYVLQYAESFFEKPIQNFKAPIQEVQKWFSSEHVAKCKRKEIEELITRLHTEQTENANGGQKTTDTPSKGQSSCRSPSDKS